MKKSILILILAITLSILTTACKMSPREPSEPSDISIKIGETNIQYVLGMNQWDGIAFDREDTFKTYIKEGYEISMIEIGEITNIIFENNPPEEVTVYDILIDENGDQLYNDKVMVSIPVNIKDGKFNFEIKKHMASYLSSFYDPDKVEFRGFRIIASWGENECEYGFIIKTKPNGVETSERQRMDLYIEVIKAAFNEENGGNEFIAVKLDTLEGLSDNAKSEFLEELNILSPDVFNFEDVKDDKTKFHLDETGGLIGAIDGTLLWIEIEEYNDDKAIITGVSWFGNLGAVFPTYEATYVDGQWHLELIRMAVS